VGVGSVGRSWGLQAGEGDTSSAALRLKKVLLSGEAGFEDHLTAVDKVFPEYTAVLLMLLHKVRHDTTRHDTTHSAHNHTQPHMIAHGWLTWRWRWR
jgi:hypothetical protein